MEDKFTGKFSAELPNGAYYEGTLVDGVMEGEGYMKFPNYNIYEGCWVSGKMEGKGIFRFYDLELDRYVAQYTGQFKDSRFNGIGNMEYPDGTVYNGHWKDGAREGEGQLFFHSGRIVSGIWHDNNLSQGTCIESNGNRYVGELSDDCQYCGYGTLFLQDGGWAQGIWQRNIFITGKYFKVDGNVLEYVDRKIENKYQWKEK